MGRNAAFGRPPASVRFRKWWDARSKTSRQNIYLALGVGALFVAIIMAATARDQSQGTRRVIASRPQPTTTLGLPTPSTVNIGDLGGASAPVTAADLFGLSTTTTTPAPATTAAPPPTRPAPTVATTEPPRPATTVTNPDVIFTTVAPASTTTTQPPATTTTAPTTTVPPSTTTTALSLPLNVPALLPAG